MNYRELSPSKMGEGISITTSNEIGSLSMNKIALVDADYIKYEVTYRMYHAMIEEGEEYFYENKERLLHEFTMEKGYSFFDKIKDPILFCFSGPSHNTFRSKMCISKKYKGSREGKKDSYAYEGKKDDMYEIFSIMNKEFNCIIYPDLEADDILSMLHCDNCYIISKDKDLKQIAGFHYNFETNKAYEISKEDAMRNLFELLMTGDSSDSIPGIYRYGIKKFEKNFKGITNPNDYLNRAIEDYIESEGFINGIDAFCEMWLLVKTRTNRGEYLKSKYETAFNLKEHLLTFLKTKQ